MARKRGGDDVETDGGSTDRATSPKPPASIDGDVLRTVVRDRMSEAKRGDLFMDGLSEDDYHHLLPRRGSNAGGNDDRDTTEAFDKFVDLVAKLMAEREKKDSSSKTSKRAKKLAKTLKSKHVADIEREILLFDGELGGGESSSHGAAAEMAEAAPAGGESPGQKDGGEAESVSMDAEPPAPSHGSHAESDGERAHDQDESEVDELSSSNTSSRRRFKKKSKKKRRKKDKKEKKRKRREKEEIEIVNDSDMEEGEGDALDGDNDSGKIVDDHEDLGASNAAVRVASAARGPAYQAAKKEFELTKDRILSELPKDVRSSFRQPGFAKWSKDHLPVLQLSPYDVSPGPVREQWMLMFKNCRRSGRPITRLVFWYGTEVSSWNEAFSFVPKSSIISYDEGVERGFGGIKRSIQKKIDGGKKLSKNDEMHIRAVKEIEEDSKREPQDRLAWAPSFEEDYEQYDSAEVQSDAQDEPVPELKEVKIIVKETKKKSKKKKVKDRDQGSHEKHVKKPPKKKSRKKVKEEEQAEEDHEAEEEQVEEEQVEDKMDVNENAYASDEIDVPSEGEKDDDFDDVNESESEEEFEFSGKKRRRKESSSGHISKKGKTEDGHVGKGREKKKKKADMTEEEKEAEHQEKLAKRRERDAIKREEKRREKAEREGRPYEPPKPRGASLKKQQEQEQRRFEICEQEILPFMERLRESVDSKNVDGARQSLRDIQGKVSIVTPPFIKEYRLGMLVKDARKVFGENHPDLESRCRSLTANMKKVYNEKHPSVPKDFKPRKTKKEDEPTAGKPSTSSRPDCQPSQPDLESRSERSVKEEGIHAERSSSVGESKSVPIKAKGGADRAKDTSVPRKTPSSAVERTTQNQPPQSSKASRKPAFSLMRIFSQPKTPSSKDAESVPQRSTSTSSSAQRSVAKHTPAWVSASEPTADGIPQDDYRLFALEHLQEAASLFPSERVNVTAIATSLESAIFDFSDPQRVKHIDRYWDKVHDVVAVLSGKGTTLQILDGVFATPMDFIKQRRKDLSNGSDRSRPT